MEELLKSGTMWIASIISVVIESVKTIAIEKITNVEIKVYISKKTCKTEHIFPHDLFDF